METTGRWIKIADDLKSIPFNDKNIAAVHVDGQKLCIIRTNEGITACTDRCPHAGGSLSSGYVDQHQNIVCCVHHYKFSLKTGRDAFNEGYFLKRFRVLVNTDGVFIEIR